MSDDKIIKKLQNSFKLNGLLVRREFCNLINESLKGEGIDLSDNESFDSYIRQLCNRLEKQCVNNKSIEKEDIQHAIEGCLYAGYDKHETVFNIISAFKFPKLIYNPDRKLYCINKKKSSLLSDANSKAQLFIDRYNSILQRVQRNFKVNTENFNLQTVDYLLTLSHKTLDKTLILGSLSQVSEGKYYLEDPTGIVELDLKHAKYQKGFFVENTFVLANGFYEDKVLQVSSILLPPGEEYEDSRPTFGNLNYFGGHSTIPLRESQRLKEHMMRNSSRVIFFFSDLWLDHPMVFEKLETIFNGLVATPPIAFVFMGNYMSESHGSEYLETLKKLFKQLGELIRNFSTLINGSEFVFVPGLSDPCTPHILPRLPLPKFVTEELSKNVPKAVFPTNPCRLQYCSREITILRMDILPKLMQGSLRKPEKDEIGLCVSRTVVSQGHLSPLSLNALTVHWDYDYTLRLYPLPDLVVIGDKSESYTGEYKGCLVTSPGSFCDSGFQFKCYTPFENIVEDCAV
ncbi:DNA polymerase epsilon subunit 2 [Onthophagus taurus]|uniref:DNA polymerase epsilon subunit 2 n=1 Tax=Onthophagus taurus TaxID=166361 RepID=UPI0039BEA08F